MHWITFSYTYILGDILLIQHILINLLHVVYNNHNAYSCEKTFVGMT